MPSLTQPHLGRIAFLAASTFLLSFEARAWAPSTQPVVDDVAYARPQNLVQVERGRRLNMYCIGAGSPTVIFESGLADDTSTWGAVQPAIAKRTRACAYDRAGVGFSDPSRRAPTSANIAADLHRLLTVARVGPPYVLVAHSSGGLPARYFARRYRDQVVGMVLIDTTHEDEIVVKRRVQPSFETGFMQQVYQDMDTCVARAKAGFPEEGDPGCIGGPEARYGDAINAARRKQHFSLAYQMAVRSESLAIASGTSGREVRSIGRSLGDMPLVVLTAPRPTGSPPPGVTPELRAALNELYTEGMKDVARLSSRGVYEAVPATGHYIQLDHPELVETKIEQVLDERLSGRR